MALDIVTQDIIVDESTGIQDDDINSSVPPYSMVHCGVTMPSMPGRRRSAAASTRSAPSEACRMPRA